MKVVVGRLKNKPFDDRGRKNRDRHNEHVNAKRKLVRYGYRQEVYSLVDSDDIARTKQVARPGTPAF